MSMFLYQMVDVLVCAQDVVAGSPAASRAAALCPGMRAVYLEWDYVLCARAVPFVVSRRAQYVN